VTVRECSLRRSDRNMFNEIGRIKYLKKRKYHPGAATIPDISASVCSVCSYSIRIADGLRAFVRFRYGTMLKLAINRNLYELVTLRIVYKSRIYRESKYKRESAR